MPFTLFSAGYTAMPEGREWGDFNILLGSAEAAHSVRRRIMGQVLNECPGKEIRMSVAKTIEISSESQEGFDAAVKDGIQKAGETVKNMKSAWIKDYEVMLDGGKITLYRVKIKITFVLD